MPTQTQTPSDPSESSDEETSSWTWSELSPFVLKTALPEDLRPEEALCERLRWIRLLWWIVLLVVYASLLLLSSKDRELSSALRQEAIDELFPDWNKAAERMKEGAKTPELKELLHVDDVAQTLTLFNDRCRDQASTTALLKAVWECKLFDVAVSNLSGSDWDPAMNRHLPDTDSDNVFGKGRKGIFETKVDAHSKELAEQRRAEMGTVCSDIFFQNHVVIGDDPKIVPWGNATAFSEKVVKRATAGGHLHPVFDTFTIRGQGQTALTDRLDELHRNTQETQQGMKKIARALHLEDLNPPEHPEDADSLLEDARAAPGRGHGPGSSFARLHRRNPWLLDVEGLATDTQQPASLMQHSGIEDGTGQNESEREQEQRMVDEDDVYYGPGCFDTNDVAGLLRDLWSTHIGEGSLSSMGKESAKKMLQEVMPNITGDKLERLWLSINSGGDGNQTLTAKEFLDFAEKHLPELQFPVRGYLNLECRNHHFGLLGLCKPESISVLYQIGFVPSDVEGHNGNMKAQRRSGTRMHVRMMFTSIEPGSGWYKADLRIFVKSQVGNTSTTIVVLMVIIVILCFCLTLFDTALTLVLMPWNFLRVMWLELPSSAAFEDIEHLLWVKILYVIDARGLQSRTSASLTILIERFIGVFFAAACVQAAREATMPNSMPMGKMSERCVYAWLRANKEWIIHSISGANVEHGLTTVTYLNECTDLHGIPYVGEVMYQFLFEEEGSCHALVVGFVCVRVLELFNLSYRLRWLPRTIFLAKFKLINFVIAYVALVAGFALLMTLYFGELYEQYSTLDRSFHTLLVYSFGMTERATYGMRPFIERSGNHLYATLFVFSVFMVTIILNMFTTIVIDAFAAEGDPERFTKAYQEEVTSYTHSLLTFFGKGHVVMRQLRKTRRGSNRTSEPSDPGDQGDPGDPGDRGDGAKPSRPSLASLMGQEVQDKEVKDKESTETES